MDVDALAPGRRLDAAIAEKVMGEPKPTGNVPDGVLAGVMTSSSGGGNWIGTTTGYTAGDEPVWLPKPYSTDIAAAWEIVESLDHGVIEDGAYQFAVHVREVFISRYTVTREGSHLKSDCTIIAHAEGETTAHVICLAALKAVEWDRSRSAIKGHDQEREGSGCVRSE